MSETDLHVRVYPEEKQRIRDRAQHHGMTMSEYVRRQVAAEERRELQAAVSPLRNVNTITKR